MRKPPMRNGPLSLASAQRARAIPQLNTFYLMWAAALVFLMQAGFAMLSAGSIRAKGDGQWPQLMKPAPICSYS